MPPHFVSPHPCILPLTSPCGCSLHIIRYEIQSAIVDEEISTPKRRGARSASVDKDAWQPIFNPCGDVRGKELGSIHTLSWVVNGLMIGKPTKFRVRGRHASLPSAFRRIVLIACIAVTNVKAYGEWSESSRLCVIGGCSYTAVGPGPGGDTWTQDEKDFFMSLDTPPKVQDYLDTLPMNQVPRSRIAMAFPIVRDAQSPKQRLIKATHTTSRAGSAGGDRRRVAERSRGRAAEPRTLPGGSTPGRLHSWAARV